MVLLLWQIGLLANVKLHFYKYMLHCMYFVYKVIYINGLFLS